jgi:hypothetical protein
MEPKSYIVLFCIAIFGLTGLGLSAVHVDKPVLTFWLIFGYVIAVPCLYAFLVQPLSAFNKMNNKKFLLLTFSVVIIAVAVTHSVWAISTPNWSFTVVTDKSTYELGQNMQITVSLKNLGFISHSFPSAISDPILISISYVYEDNSAETTQVWFSSFHNNRTEFTIPPSQSLERVFVWNQTTRHQPEINITSGTYLIEAQIPRADSEMGVGLDNLFLAWTFINITTT